MRLLQLVQEWDFNPQLLRELKGRLNGRNLAIASAVSVIIQVLLYVFWEARLPGSNKYHRYCLGTPPLDLVHPSQVHNPPNNYCFPDVAVNWQLWWLDLFTTFSVLGLFTLLVVGTYLLIDDLAREERRGTLGFIHLSPQPALSIWTGKLLGVPILLYLAVALAFPLHLYAGLAAGLPLGAIFSFYLVVAASCLFFYSAALLFGLVSTEYGSFQAWFGSGAVFLYLLLTMGLSFADRLVVGNSFDWLTLFYPGKILPYVVSLAPHSLATIDYLNVKDAAHLEWFGLALWEQLDGAVLLLLLNFGWWTYWACKGFQRRFERPNCTLLAKSQSFWISGSFAIAVLGFAYQDGAHLTSKLSIVLALMVLMFVGLSAAVSPQRQALQDWARYRHQTPKAQRHGLRDWLVGEKSPSLVAIAFNLALVSLILLPSMLFTARTPDLLFAWLLCVGLIAICASLTQLLLMMKTPRRGLLAAATVGMVLILPPTFGFHLVSAFPLAAMQRTTEWGLLFTLLAEWGAIALLNLRVYRLLQKAGESSSKALFASQQQALKA